MGLQSSDYAGMLVLQSAAPAVGMPLV